MTNQTQIKVGTTNNMKQYILFTVFLFLGTGHLFASKEDPEIERAFKNLVENKPIELKGKKRPESIKAVIDDKNHSIVEVLFVLQAIKNGTKAAKIEELQKLLEFHKARTFEARYPEHWRYIRAKDYDAMLCREIEAAIQLAREEQNKAQHPTDGAAEPKKPKE